MKEIQRFLQYKQQVKKGEIWNAGIVKDAEISVENGICHIEIHAVTVSEMLDRKKKQKSFQNVMMTYKQAVGRILEPYEKMVAVYAEEARENLNEPIIQYGETDWEFLMRLGSRLHMPLYAEYETVNETLYFGMRKGRHVELESDAYHVGVSRNYYKADPCKDNITRKDYLYYRISSDKNCQIGDDINVGSGNYVIFKKIAELVREKLEFTYWAGKCGNWYIPNIEHDQLTGMEFIGTVVSTQKETANIRLGIDERSIFH